MQSVSIIGIGRVGGALAISLSKEGYSVNKLFSKGGVGAAKIASQIDGTLSLISPDDFHAISEDIVIIATQDSEILRVVKDLRTDLVNGKRFIFHTSGSLSSDILTGFSKKGIGVGSIHPLVSISDPVLGARRFSDAYFCVEGDPEAVDVAEKIVGSLGGKSFAISPDKKALYHASAVTACGHFVALIDSATEILSKCGIDNKEAKAILMPLVESTVENLKEQSFQDALTGTFARGDVQTLASHIETLDENVSEELLVLYLELGKRSLKVASERGLDQNRVSAMRVGIENAKKKM